jgi:spoIIIJ-associated protein
MDPDEEQPAVEDQPAMDGDPGEIARQLLQDVLRAMDLEGTVECQEMEEGSYQLNMEGPDMAVVIGRHGSTLGALQYLLTLIVNRRTGRKLRLVLDAEGYRHRREEALRETARSWAERVKETGQECVLDPMPAFDRRIVHTALADDPDIYTYSEGDEPERSVVISPRLSDSANPSQHS